ncbi:hypothetical protein HXX76_006588 [Chlamydomonas incerta]|uniref:Uncharacterized protein n=1 Tax=Chlamydomonas incerta TaxID=51695 RepID=A0A835T3C0_CHLIN|nr:hypothetical protein HXX76_006588 [Chlamydomonas incerta]|eukprot:KAG2436277.1 hypothetical protein HXX76_006588 [Chlamydomonas incerta]
MAQQSQQLLAPAAGPGASAALGKPSVRVTVDANSLWAAALAAGGSHTDLSALKSVLAGMGGGKAASMQALNSLSASLAATTAGGKRLPLQPAAPAGGAATVGTVAGSMDSTASFVSVGEPAKAGSPGVDVSRAAGVPAAVPAASGLVPHGTRTPPSSVTSSLLSSGGSNGGSLKAPVGLSRCTIVEDAPFPPPNTQVVMELHEKTLRVGGRRLRYRGFRPADRPTMPAPGSAAGADTVVPGGRGGAAPDQLATRQLPRPPGMPPTLDGSTGADGAGAPEHMQLSASAAATAAAALGAMPHYYSFASNNQHHFHQQQQQQEQQLHHQSQQELGAAGSSSALGGNSLAALAAGGGGRVSVSVKVPWAHPAALLQGSGAGGAGAAADMLAPRCGGGGGLLESLNAALASGSGYMVVGAAVRPGCAMLQLDLLVLGGRGGGGGRGRGRRALGAMMHGAHDADDEDIEDDEEVEPLPLALLYGGGADGTEINAGAVAAAVAGALGMRSAADLAAEIARHVGAAAPPASHAAGAGGVAQLLVSLADGASYVLSLANPAGRPDGSCDEWQALPLESAAAAAAAAAEDAGPLAHSGGMERLPLALAASRDRAAVAELLSRVSAAAASAALRAGRPMPATAVAPTLQLRVLPAAAAVVAPDAPVQLTLLVEVVAPAVAGLGARGGTSSVAERDAACTLLSELLAAALVPQTQQEHGANPELRLKEQRTPLRQRRATESDSGSDASSACQAPPPPARRSASDSALDSTLDDSDDWDELPERDHKLPEPQEALAAGVTAGAGNGVGGEHDSLPRGFYVVANLLGRSLPVRAQHVTPVARSAPTTLAAAAVMLTVEGAAAALQCCGCTLSPLSLELWHGSCQAAGSAQVVAVVGAAGSSVAAAGATGSVAAAEAVAAELRALAAAEAPDAMRQVVQDLGSVESYAAVAAAAPAGSCAPQGAAVLLPGSVDLWPELRASMAASLADPDQRGELGLMAANLLSYAVLRGLPATAAVVRRALRALGYGLEHADAMSAADAGATELYEDEVDAAACGIDGGAGSEDEQVGLPLVHLAALSGNIGVVRQVLGWAAEEGLGSEWVLRRHRGRSPRQAAVEAVAASAAVHAGGVDGGGRGFVAYLAELDLVLPKEEAATAAAQQQRQQQRGARLEANAPAAVSWLEPDSSWREEEQLVEPGEPADGSAVAAADGANAEDDVGWSPRVSSDFSSGGGAGGRDQKCSRPPRPGPASASASSTASGAAEEDAAGTTPVGAAAGSASPFSHTAGAHDSYPCSPASPPASSRKSTSNLPAAPLAAVAAAAAAAAGASGSTVATADLHGRNAAGMSLPAPPPEPAAHQQLSAGAGAAHPAWGSSAPPASAASPSTAPARSAGRWRRHALTCCLLGYPDAGAEARYQRFIVPYEAHVTSSWVPVMACLFLAALGRQLRPGGGGDPSEGPASVLFAGPYVLMTACLAFCPSWVLGSRGGSGPSGSPRWRLRGWWLACWLSRLALKPLLRLGVLPVPPSMVQYSRSGVTLVTDTLLPGLCERMPLSLALPLRLLDALAHLQFVMQTGIATSFAGALLHALLRLGLFFAAAGSVELCNRRRFEKHVAAAAAAPAPAVPGGNAVQDAGPKVGTASSCN